MGNEGTVRSSLLVASRAGRPRTRGWWGRAGEGESRAGEEVSRAGEERRGREGRADERGHRKRADGQGPGGKAADQRIRQRTGEQ